MQIDLSLPFIFALLLLFVSIFYWIGGRIGARGEKSPEKTAPYACGEDLSPRKYQVDIERLFIYAVCFLIFDILAFILVTSMDAPGFFPAIYASIVSLSFIMLIPVWWRK